MVYFKFVVVSYTFRRCCCCYNLVLGLQVLHWSRLRIIWQIASSADKVAPHTTKLSFTPLCPSRFITKENNRSENECDHSLKRVISLGTTDTQSTQMSVKFGGLGQENILVSTCISFLVSGKYMTQRDMCAISLNSCTFCPVLKYENSSWHLILPSSSNIKQGSVP